MKDLVLDGPTTWILILARMMLPRWGEHVYKTKAY